MQYNVDNNKLANLILSNNFATQDQIIQLWQYITPQRDIGQLLVSQNILPMNVYQKMIAFLAQPATSSQQQQSQQDVRPNQSSNQNPGQQNRPVTMQPQAQNPMYNQKNQQNQSQAQAGYQQSNTGRPMQAQQKNAAPQHQSQMQQAVSQKASIGQSAAPKSSQPVSQQSAMPPVQKPLPAQKTETKGTSSQENEIHRGIPEDALMEKIEIGGGEQEYFDPSSRGIKLDADDDVSSRESSGYTGDLPDIRELFRYARSIDASDIHLSVNNPVIVRRYGVLAPTGESIITPEYMHAQIRILLKENQFDSFRESGDLECVVDIENAGRFRVTVMKQRAGWDCTARCIPDRIRSFEETGMPQACRGLTEWAQGLVLVTGPACCGKSSTLATLVEMLNQTRPDHMITIESPIEQVFASAKAQITQRQIGRDTASQEAALRAALREDPDIIVVGELRDLSTIQLAVSAAETGHLVFATMNTINASRTIYRLIDSFPPEEQAIIRNMVSESLRGVISQQLVPRIDCEGLVAAYEVLLVNSAVANMIRKDEAHQLGTAMITGKASGMQLLDDSLKALAAQGIISQQEVNARCVLKTPQ
ncbi:MAG: PilT/PilU family type 4a pilus ATPase [Fibrobacterota bacterium]|nr:PilT/PilU family type 4a pilus ATPase [Chitinispirillaceae bacterium]